MTADAGPGPWWHYFGGEVKGLTVDPDGLAWAAVVAGEATMSPDEVAKRFPTRKAPMGEGTLTYLGSFDHDPTELERAAMEPEEYRDAWAEELVAAATDPLAALVTPEDPHAPPWVESVTLDDLEVQRERGWPDFHPEDFCGRCGRRNPVWWTPSDVWNEATGPERELILCPSCFAVDHEAATGERSCWVFRVETPGASS